MGKLGIDLFLEFFNNRVRHFRKKLRTMHLLQFVPILILAGFWENLVPWKYCSTIFAACLVYDHCFTGSVQIKYIFVYFLKTLIFNRALQKTNILVLWIYSWLVMRPRSIKVASRCHQGRHKEIFFMIKLDFIFLKLEIPSHPKWLKCSSYFQSKYVVNVNLKLYKMFPNMSVNHETSSRL